jgi:hypothetical protein
MQQLIEHREIWYRLMLGDPPALVMHPWYREKYLPSFMDALAAFRTKA